MIEIIISLVLAWYFVDYILPKIRTRLGKPPSERLLFETRLFHYFALHRKKLVIFFIVSLMGIFYTITAIISSILRTLMCINHLINGDDMLQHMGICGMLQWMDAF